MTWSIAFRPPTSWSNSHVSTNSREEHFVREQRSCVAMETASGVLAPRPVRLLMLRKRSSKTGWTKREPRGQRDQGHGVKRLLTGFLKIPSYTYTEFVHIALSGSHRKAASFAARPPPSPARLPAAPSSVSSCCAEAAAYRWSRFRRRPSLDAETWHENETDKLAFVNLPGHVCLASQGIK